MKYSISIRGDLILKTCTTKKVTKTTWNSVDEFGRTVPVMKNNGITSSSKRRRPRSYGTNYDPPPPDPIRPDVSVRDKTSVSTLELKSIHS